MEKATFYFPIQVRKQEMIAALAPTLKAPEEREFVVDSAASMLMPIRKELSSEEMDTSRRSRMSTTVVPANGEVQTSEEAQVYVHDLDLFVTDTPAVLS